MIQPFQVNHINVEQHCQFFTHSRSPTINKNMQGYLPLITNSFTIGTTAQVVSGVAMRTNLFRRSFTVHMSVTVYVL